MLANHVKETTATTGTGTITLAGAVSGFAPFSAAFSNGDKVQYSLEGAAGREIGVGTYSAGTITRDWVLEKLVGGVITRNTTAVSLTGTTNVMIAATSNNGLSWPILVPGLTTTTLEQPCNMGGSATTNVAYGADIIHYVDIYLSRPRILTGMTINCTTAGGAAPDAMAGIYSVGANAKPGGRLGSVAFSLATTGNKSTTFSSPLFLDAGWYFGAFINESATAQIRGYSNANHKSPSILPRSIFNNMILTSYTETVSSGWTDLPATAGTVTLDESQTVVLPAWY